MEPMADGDRHPLADALRAALAACAASAVATALVDVSLAALRAGEPTGARSLLLAFGAALALYAAVALPARLAVRLVAGSIPAPPPVRARLAPWRPPLAPHPERHRDPAP